jgi:CO dehydrogenase/acetyl-CoA synthase beta subunit
MGLFELKIEQLRSQLEDATPEPRVCSVCDARGWPRRANKQMILEQDMGVELGKGGLQSFAAVLWTESMDRVRDGVISVYGQDIPLLAAPGGARSVPFGKVALLGVDFIPSKEVYAAFEKMDAVRFAQNLKGYMLRGFTQRNREWSRISREACNNGFDFTVLGSELIRDYLALPFVRRAEMFFFTDDALIRALAPVIDECHKITRALNTIFEGIHMDCKSCDEAPICAEIDGLRRLHDRLVSS